MLGFAQMFQGAWAEALETGARLAQLNERLTATVIRAMSDTIEGSARFHHGEPERGIEVLRRAVSDHETTGAGMALGMAYACLAEKLLLAGQPAEAAGFARKAIARCAVGDRVGETYGHRTLALTEPPGTDAALEHARTAIRLAVERGSEREAALARCVEARVLADAGARAAARSQLRGRCAAGDRAR